MSVVLIKNDDDDDLWSREVKMAAFTAEIL